MEYRKRPRRGENISILGLGTSSIGMAGEKGIEAAMTMALEAGKKAGDCVGCGHCDNRCPLHVAQSDRMAEIHAYFDL